MNATKNVTRCMGATNGKAPSPGCGHAAHSPYGCLHRDDDGIPCDCAGDATDDERPGFDSDRIIFND